MNIAVLWFSETFFESKVAREIVFIRLWKPLRYLNTVLLFLSFFLPYSVGVKAIAFSGLSAIVLVLSGSCLAWLRGDYAARYFVIAWFAFLLGALVWIGGAIGVVPTSFFTEFGVQIGSALEVMLLTFALGDKMNQLLIERDEANRALLETYQLLDDELLRRESLQAANLQLEKDNQVASEQLIKADKLATLGTLVAGVAHDIANPTGLGKAGGELITESRVALETLIHHLLKDQEGEEVVTIREKFDTLLSSIRTGEGHISLAITRIAAINNAIRNQSRVEDHRRAPLSGRSSTSA